MSTLPRDASKQEAELAAVDLAVSEAIPKDVGRAIARVDPAAMQRLGAQVGDIVEVKGARATVARLMPTYPGERGKGAVQIDGITRQNAQIGLGERVQIRKVPFAEAGSLALAPATSSKAFMPGNSDHHLGRVLEGLPVVEGDRVRATLLGGGYQEFSVAECHPEGAVLIGPRTSVQVRGGSSREKAGTTYEDIGGVRRELQKIREMIELPLKYPELFERLGIEPPKGVLLHGPPGCGKTLIARAVANETDAAFFPISGPEVIHKFYGESEAHLRAVFEEASRKAPAIIFIDEIDAIAAKREEVRGDQQVERRVVAQLLALMDGLKSRGNVIVIGATNIPHVLDPALRRPGRFDREITIGVPDRNGRLQVLEIHTRGMPLASDVSLERLADVTHGFVGADLEALCREAAMTRLREALPGLSLHPGRGPSVPLPELEISMADFLQAFREIEPSAIREVFTEIPDVKWEEIGGLEQVKRALRENIEWPIKHPHLFQQARARPPRGILLSGPPGTGKTLLAKAVATQCGVNFISVKGPALLSKWVGESEKGIREVFKKARQASPCIVFFDEIDALAPVRRGSGDGDVGNRVVAQLLTELDGIEGLEGVVVLAATNRADLLDSALLRAGRFDLHLELPVPDTAARREIYAIHTRDKPLSPDVELDALAERSQGLVGSDIDAICREASMRAIRQFVEQHGPSSDGVALQITAQHFEQALSGWREGGHEASPVRPHHPR